MRSDCGASRIGGEERDLRGDAVEGVGRGLGVDRGDHDRVGAGGDEVVHQRVLQRGGALRRIAELQLVVRQLGLGLLHAGLGELPEVRGRVDDEGELRLVLRLGRGPGSASAATTPAMTIRFI